MKSTVRIELEKSKGYSGIKGRRSYIARITGLCPQYGLDRQFREPDEIDWGGSSLYKKSKGSWTELHDLSPGIYERCQYGDVDRLMVWIDAATGEVKWGRIDRQRAEAIAGLLDDGQQFEAARQATRPQRQETSNGAAQ